MLITRGLGKIIGGSGTVKVPEYVHITDPLVKPSLSNTTVYSSVEVKPSIKADTDKLKPIVSSDINLSTLNIDVTQIKPHIKGNL